MQKMNNIKSVTSRQEIKPVKVNITSEQFQALTKMYSLGQLRTKNVERDRIQKQLQQQQINNQQTSTPRNNTPQSCRTAQEMKYFLYQKNNGKDQVKILNNSQVLPKTKNSLHRNFSQLEKSGNTQLQQPIQSSATPKQKNYNLLSVDSRFTSHNFAYQIAQQLKKKNEPIKKENLKVSLDDFVTQINRPSKSLISPFKQTKSLSPSNRIEQQTSSKSKKQIYYVTSLQEAFKHPYPQTPEQQLFKDHAVQTFNCVGFCINLSDPDLTTLQQKQLDLPKKTCKFNKTVVFDLDETLIHCNENQSLKADVYLPITFPSGDTVQAGINIRPFAQWILKELSQICEVVVFTASHQCYASQVIQYLDPQNNMLSAQLFRDKCVLSSDGVHIKDLRVFNRNLKDIVLVDNAAYSFGVHLENGIPIIPYYDNKDDKELKLLYDFLVNQVLPAPDSRLVLQSTFKLREFQKYNEPRLAVEKLF